MTMLAYVVPVIQKHLEMVCRRNLETFGYVISESLECCKKSLMDDFDQGPENQNTYKNVINKSQAHGDAY